jgi:hypothetical protein
MAALVRETILLFPTICEIGALVQVGGLLSFVSVLGDLFP